MTFPGGGVYPWVWIPVSCALLILASVVRPAIAADTRARALDLTLLLCGFAIIAQLVPLPYSILQAVDPNAIPLRQALWIIAPGSNVEALWLPVSIVPRDTLAALGVFGAAALMFWTCREICKSGGADRIVQAVALIGLLASMAAIVQRAGNKELLYGIWRPVDAGARPYGPFVNRNHFATWIIMASPLVFGYLLALAPTVRPKHLSQRVVAALKQLGSIRVWLVAAVCLMTLAMLISTSRSGIIGLMGAMTASAWLLGRRRRESGVLRWMMLQGALLMLIAVTFVNFGALAARFDETLAASVAGRGRSAVWADARRIVKDFAITGTGAGTFGAAVPVYQTAEPGYSIGHAHNHYLQLAAEGGVLLGAPAVMVMTAFVALYWSRLTADATPMYLMRAGAAAGMSGALLQSVWETGLRMPANAMLFAVLAAIATHDTSGAAWRTRSDD